MMYFTKMLVTAFSGLDPLIFLITICFSLGASLVAMLWELEQLRIRGRSQTRARGMPPKSQAVLRQRAPHRRS